MMLDGEIKPHELRKQRSETRAKALCAVVAVLFCAIFTLSALSGIARYASSDKALSSYAKATDLDGLFVSDGEGRTSLSSYLASAMAYSGEGVFLTESGAKKIIKTPFFKEYFAGLVVEGKNRLLRGDGAGDVSLAPVADLLLENADGIEAASAVKITPEAAENMRAALSGYVIDLGGDIESEAGVGYKAARLFLSGAFFFITLSLAVGALGLLAVAGNFKAKYFFGYAGGALLVTGLALSSVLLVLMLKTDVGGVVTSEIAGAALIPFAAVAGGAVVLGLIFTLVSAVISKKSGDDPQRY